MGRPEVQSLLADSLALLISLAAELRKVEIPPDSKREQLELLTDHPALAIQAIATVRNGCRVVEDALRNAYSGRTVQNGTSLVSVNRSGSGQSTSTGSTVAAAHFAQGGRPSQAAEVGPDYFGPGSYGPAGHVEQRQHYPNSPPTANGYLSPSLEDPGWERERARREAFMNAGFGDRSPLSPPLMALPSDSAVSTPRSPQLYPKPSQYQRHPASIPPQSVSDIPVHGHPASDRPLSPARTDSQPLLPQQQDKSLPRLPHEAQQFPEQPMKQSTTRVSLDAGEAVVCQNQPMVSAAAATAAREDEIPLSAISSREGDGPLARVQSFTPSLAPSNADTSSSSFTLELLPPGGISAKAAGKAALLFTELTPSDVDTDQVYVTCREYIKSEDNAMDVNLKVGDKVRITCVMDDNETALGCNLVTGAQGTFALANLAFLDEWEARKDGVGVPARTPTVQSINSASQTPSSANVTNKDLTGSPDRLSAGQVLPSGLVVDRAMADLGRSDTLDTIAILNAEPSSSSTVPVGRYPTPPAATVSAAATPTTTSTTPTNYTHPVPAYATAVVDANSSLSTTPATSTRSTAPTTLTTSTPQIPGRYLAIKSYPSQSEMEVSLKLGDEVDVMFFAESGTTAFGLHVPSKQQGAFPASYLRKVPEPAGRRKDAAMIPMSAFAGMPGFGSGSGLGSSSSMGGSSSGMATGVVGSLSSTSTAAVNPYSADPVPQASSELPSRSTSLSGGTTPSSSSGGGPGGPTPTDYLSRNSTISHPPTRSTTVLERNESMGPHGPEGLLPPDPTADQARPLRQPITPSQQQSPYRDSVIAAIAALEEENAAAYKLYSDTIDRFRENGRPVPMAMNLELMKTLTNNMAQYSWDPETREERLRETAGSEDLNHPPTGTVVPPGHPLFNQHQHPQHAQQQNPNTHIPIMPRSTSFEGEIPAAAIEQLQQQQHAQNTKRTSIFRDRSGHAPYHVGALGASSGPLQNGKPSPPAVEQPPSAPVRLSDEQERRRKTLLSIIKELEFTEHNYCNDLKVLIDHMMVPMQNEPYVRKTDLDHIFRMIPQLSALSNIFSLELTDAVRQFDTNPFAVGAAFLGHVEEWSMYTQYVENYAMAKKTIRRLEDSPVHGTAFKEFLEKCRRTPECRRTDIHGFLILPIQRISRYWLLLQRMRKYCEDTPERETLEVAEHYMFEIGSMLDYVKRRDDETHRMFEIATEVKGFPANLISFTQRRFIGDYEAEEVTGAKRLILFLFSDALLVCTFRRQRDVQQDGKIYELQLQVDSKSMSVDVDEVDPSIIKLRFIECQPVSTGSVRLPARRADSTPIPPQPAQPPAPSSGGGGGIHLPSFRHSFMSTSSAASSTTSQVPLAHHNVIDGTLSRPLAPDEMFMMLLRFRDSRAHDTFLADVKKNEDMVARKRGKDAAASHPSTTESHPSLSVSSENTTSEQQQMKRRSMGDRQPSVFELTNGEEFLNELYYRGKVG